MPIPSEFQEREYETLFNQELVKLGCFIWSPGQTDEFLLGFDGATWIDPLKLVRFGFPTPVPVSRWRHRVWPLWEPEFWFGQTLHPSFLNDWRRFADDFFPPKAVNFFVQHKRPSQTSEEGVCGDHWGQAYYEYKIGQQQQARLEQLENQIGKSGLVTYSCAAFLKKAQLWDYERDQNIIGKSNFVGASKLANHTRYSFIEAGHSGFANAEPEVITDEPILKKLRASYENSTQSFSAQIKNAGRVVQNIMNDEDSNDTDLYYRLLERISKDTSGSAGDESILKDLISVVVFCTINSTSWSIVVPTLSEK